MEMPADYHGELITADAPLLDQISPEQLEEFRDAFELFDKDDDGVISASELKDVMIFLGTLPTRGSRSASTARYLHHRQVTL
eukprot:COSAG02_NODE_1381_length_12972_cov_75.630700_1_plen_82_part_00